MSDRSEIRVGDRVRNLVGHWFDVVDGGPWRFRVQPLTEIGTELRPLGAPVWVGRSDLRAAGE